MTIFQIEIIKRAENVSRNNTGESITKLIVHTSKYKKYETISLISYLLILNVNHSFCIGVAKVRLMRRSVMDHAFVDWVSCLVRKYAS